MSCITITFLKNNSRLTGSVYFHLHRYLKRLLSEGFYYFYLYISSFSNHHCYSSSFFPRPLLLHVTPLQFHLHLGSLGKPYTREKRICPKDGSYLRFWHKFCGSSYSHECLSPFNMVMKKEASALLPKAAFFKDKTCWKKLLL